jgi:hypothetical protein
VVPELESAREYCRTPPSQKDADGLRPL